MATAATFLSMSVFLEVCFLYFFFFFFCFAGPSSSRSRPFSFLPHVLMLVRVISAHLKTWKKASHFVCVTHISDIPLLLNIINCNIIEQLHYLKCH